MHKGGGKSKGSAFEREVCVKLSLWVTQGQRKDTFWRSAMSGGRSTVARKKGEYLQTSTGDITAIHPLGTLLTDRFLIECKHVKNLHLHRFVTEQSGLLAEFWEKVCQQAIDHRKKPILICKQNQYPILLLIGEKIVAKPRCTIHKLKCYIYLFADVLGRKFELRR